MIHAIERAKERYCITLDRLALHEIEQRLERGEGMLLSRNNDAERRVIRVEGQLVVVVFHMRDKKIMTFAPSTKQRGRYGR